MYLFPSLPHIDEKTMASSNITLPSFKSYFLGTNHILNRPTKPNLFTHKHQPHQSQQPCAKFNLYEIMGGRGLCNGEAGLKKELAKTVEDQKPPVGFEEQEKPESTIEGVPAEGFEKELLGLTGGFPGGEKGLKLFIEKNPPPPPKKSKGDKKAQAISLTKPKPPELPLLLPGMIAIVSNPNNPYYMYTGIVQRITDGKAGVLFEGGNWDRLITFRLEELERREKGPPGKNPKSAILEPLLQKDPQ